MPLRWGFCGTGNICHDFASALKSLDAADHALAAVAARDLGRAKAFAEKFEFASAYDDYDEIAASNDVDIVYIGVIAIKHYDLTKAMIQAGKNVLCESPMTLSAKQVEDLFHLAEKKGVFLMEAIWTRCFPLYQRIAEEIVKGSIGEVMSVHCNLGFPVYSSDSPPNKSLGNGGLTEFGVYLLQAALTGFGRRRPDEVVVGAVKHSTGVDVGGVVFLRFGEEKFANLSYSVTSTMKSSLTFFGSSGSIEIPELFWCPTKILVNGEKLEFPLPESKLTFNFPNSQGLAYEAEHVRKCIEANRPESDLMSRSDSLIVHEILDTCFERINLRYDS